MRYFKLKNSVDEQLDITTREVFFHEIGGLGFEETTDFQIVGPVWRLNSAEYAQTAVTGKILFTEYGDLNPYQKYTAFRNFIEKTPLTIIYYPNGDGSEAFYKKVRATRLSKSELNEYGVLDCDIEFMPYTPWYTTVTNENIVPEDTEIEHTGWIWDIGNSWRDVDSESGDPVGAVYHPFSQMTDLSPALVHPDGDQTTFLVTRGNSPVPFTINRVFTIPPGYYRMKLQTNANIGWPAVDFVLFEERDGEYQLVRKADYSLLGAFKADAEEDIYISSSNTRVRFYLPANEPLDFTVQLKLTKIADEALYKFAYETRSSLSFNVDADVKGLAKLKIKGPATNPQWTHYVDGKIVSSGGISSDSDLTLGADDTLVVDNTEGAYTIDLVKPNGDVVNVYSLRDFDRKCFITLEPGENTITVSSKDGDPLSFEIEGWLLYATV